MNITDAGGQNVGIIYLLNDIRSIDAAFSEEMWMSLISAMIVVGALLVALSFIASGIEGKISFLTANREVEYRRRLSMEEQLLSTLRSIGDGIVTTVLIVAF